MGNSILCMFIYVGDPDYDPTSLFIPENFFTDKTTSEAQKQFWQIKRYHFNRVVFFQQGTFYNVK